VGLGMAAEEFGSRFFGNDARPGGVLMHPGRLSDSARVNLSYSWDEAHRPLENKHRVAILEEGMKWETIGMPLADAQFIELRKFQRSEIATLFNVPPHMIGDTERSTSWGTGIEQQAIGYVVHTLRPILISIEQRCLIDLLLLNERSRYFIEHLIDGLLRGDAMTRAQALAIQRQNGIICADEWRELENRNPIPEGAGKIYLVNGNMITPEAASKAGKSSTNEGVSDES